jgi:hypothetical protein
MVQSVQTRLVDIVHEVDSYVVPFEQDEEQFVQMRSMVILGALVS